jgi:hypothetical protein
VTMKIRSDWDLGEPGLRESWESGDKRAFWPYGRSMKFLDDGDCRVDANVAHTQSGPIRVHVARRSAIGSRATSA